MAKALKEKAKEVPVVRFREGSVRARKGGDGLEFRHDRGQHVTSGLTPSFGSCQFGRCMLVSSGVRR